MSPTPTPSDASLAEIKRLRDALIEAEFGDASDMIGCDDDQIAQVAAAAEFPLPDGYVAFLKVLGRKAGALFQGGHFYYPEPLNAIEVARDISEEPDENLTLPDRFFFGHHQGYKVFFFEKGSPAVYVYQEGHPEIQRLGDTFLSWLWLVFDRTRSVREETKRLRAENEATRAKMREEGKL
ncbi:SMI1/KNR4 family protein [Nocardia sp. CA-129566]|uniref:SMI1/KNR4 family protein n=1 Tax=Nocardia sp. CA-129566 TaxID=3239976 RepID=UPI003D95B840